MTGRGDITSAKALSKLASPWASATVAAIPDAFVDAWPVGRNQVRNFENDRLRVSQALFRAI